MAGRWRAITKLHPPLPMSPRESQRLLALINTSFKQELDRHHPTTVADHTSDHLYSILSNPLFEAKPTDITVSSSTRHGKGGNHLGVGQILVKRPVDLFKEQIVAGTATLQSAILCLQAEYNSCCMSSAAVHVEALRTSRIGSIVIQWLWSSGADECGAFLGNPDFIRLIVPFLVAEKRHDRVWTWFDHLRLDWTRTSYLSQAASKHRDYSMLLLQLVRSEIIVGDGLDAAIALFIRSANEYGRKDRNPTHKLAAWYLTNALKNALKGIPRATAIQDSTIRSFMEASGTLSKPNTLMSGCHWVHLAKIPDPDIALGYFVTVSCDSLRSKKRQNIVPMALKTIEVLLESGRQADACWLMDHLRKNFSWEVGSLATSDREPKSQGLEEAEERSLRSLDALAIH